MSDEEDTKPRLLLSEPALSVPNIVLRDHSPASRVYTFHNGVIIIGIRGSVVVERGPMAEGGSALWYLQQETEFLERVREASEAVK